MKTKDPISLALLLFTLLTISCTEKNDDFIEFTYGLSMNPRFPRAGIKILGDNHVYYCEEVMNKGDESYLNHTGKYRFYKSEKKINFSDYINPASNQFSSKINNETISIHDATFENVSFNFKNKNEIQYFYTSQLNPSQQEIYNKIWRLKDELKFKPTDSIYFNQKLLQEKLPGPPSITD